MMGWWFYAHLVNDVRVDADGPYQADSRDEAERFGSPGCSGPYDSRAECRAAMRLVVEQLEAYRGLGRQQTLPMAVRS